MFYSNIVKIPLVSKDAGFLEDPFVVSDIYIAIIYYIEASKVSF